MGDGTKENPYTREDVIKLIEENNGTAENLFLQFDKVFEEGIYLGGLNLNGISLDGAVLVGANFETDSWGNYVEGHGHIHTYLTRASLTNTHLERASLAGANLKHAALVHAHLEGALFYNKQLDGTNLEGHT